MISGVYRIRNEVTGAAYVGSTLDIKRRKAEHFKRLRAGSHPCAHLQNSAAKHGVSALAFEVLLECPARDLLDNEQAEIDRVVATAGRESLYNANPKADRSEWTEESKAKLRAKRVGVNNPFYGKKHTAESMAQMSSSQVGHAAWNKGKKATPECRAAISAAGVGRIQSDATRAKRSATIRRLAREGKLFHPKHLAALSAGQRSRRIRENKNKDI